MSNEEVEEKVGLDHLDDKALTCIVEAAVAKHGDDLDRYPRWAEIAFEELARRSGYTVPAE